MSALDDIYAFSSQSDIDRLSLSVKKTEGRFNVGGGGGGGESIVTFAKVTEIVEEITIEVDGEEETLETDQKVAKGIEYIYDSDTFSLSEAPDPLIFDEDDTTLRKTGYIYSDTAMKIGDIVEVFKYVDIALKENQKNNMQWLKRSSGGAERPVIMSAGELFEFGAIITSPTDLAPIREFTEEDAVSFASIMPWSNTNGTHTADAPEDFIYVGDLQSSILGPVYYTESYPKTLWAKPLDSYPLTGGITSFDILDSCSDTANILLSSSSEDVTAELVLAGFDNSEASTTVQEYFINKFFPCSYDHVSGNFFFTHPIF